MKEAVFNFENLVDPSDIVMNKTKIKEYIKDDGFYINLEGDEDSFYIVFQDFLETANYGYCGIEDLASGGAEPYNEESDGDVIIYNSGLVENWFYNFWMPETELTDGQSETPLRVKLSGYFVRTNDGIIFYPVKMEWNEDDLLEKATS